MDDLISRSALLETLKEYHDYIMQDPAVCFRRTVDALETAPAVDAETVFQQMGLVKEAFDMAKSSLVPVVRCEDCKHYRTHGDIHGLCYYGTGMRFMYNDGFCSYGERRGDNADLQAQ